MEGLIHGGKFAFHNLALQLKVNLPFLFCICGQYSKYKPSEGLYLEGRFNGGFFALMVWGLIFGGAYTWRGLFSEFYGISFYLALGNH